MAPDRRRPRPGSPAANGYRMPAEWEPHAATWIAWPRDPLTWVRGIEPAEAAFLEMVRALAPGERVEILVHDEAQRDRVQGLLDEHGLSNTRLHPVGHVDSWIRDYGPTLLTHRTQGDLLGIDWTFNAWGGKYEALQQDDRLGAEVAKLAGAPAVRVPYVFEGGGLEVNGQGLVLTTEQCLLNQNRNPELSREEVEQILCDHLGIQQVLWLGEGVAGDDTDGHVDDIARFVDPTTVLAASAPDPGDPNHAPLADNLDRLSRMTTLEGEPLQVVELPMPSPVLYEGEPLPASYANFYIGNEVVLLPTYQDPADARAEAILSEHVPGREVVPIDCRDLIVGMGACHCLTQQQPA